MTKRTWRIVRQRTVFGALFIVAATISACEKGPTAPSTISAPTGAAQANQEPGSSASVTTGEQGATSWTSSPTVITIPNLTLPKPVLTVVSPTSAAPGAAISVYGKDLNPQGPLVFTAPKVVFAGNPGYFPQSAHATSNTELRVVVPPGSGSAQVRVQTAGGTSGNLRFVYKVPTITGIFPASAPRGQLVTLTGNGFGVKQALDSSFIKFGDSVVAQATQWSDQRIVVRAPNDFGTGLNSDILVAVIGCVSGLGAGSAAEKWILKVSLPGCSSLVNDVFRRYQLGRNPGFVTKAVSVVVRTSAGISNARTFTYTVQTETR